MKLYAQILAGILAASVALSLWHNSLVPSLIP